MTGTQLAALIRYKTKTNSTTFSDTDMLPLVNTFKDEIASLIADRNQMYFAVPSDDDLVADQREYAIPDDMLNNLVKVEVKFTATEARKVAKALKNYDGSETESEIVTYFINDEPFYVIRRRAILLLSGTIIAVTDGMRIWYLSYPADLADLVGVSDLSIDPSTTTHGFPRQFHELLARRVAIEYKNRNKISLGPTELSYNLDLQKQLDAISHLDLSLEIIGTLPSGEELWNSGFDL